MQSEAMAKRMGVTNDVHENGGAIAGSAPAVIKPETEKNITPNDLLSDEV